MEIKDHTNLVIAGNWNLGILTPDWIIKEFPDKIKQKKDVPIEVSIGIGSIRFTIDDIIIQPNLNRLDLITNIEDDLHYNKIMDIALGIVQKLPHTPLSAIGHNISYYLTTETFKFFDEEKLDLFEDRYKEIIKNTVFNSQQIKHSLDFEDHILNIIYEVNRKKSHVNFNFNYKVSDRKKIESYISSFKENISSSKNIFKKLVV
ncbi:MAG TPA: hypothetical protein ENI15_04685 [Spirochaetes bacterium]|nr:hypothetical protein [Spirochaetota bacterium]